MTIELSEYVINAIADAVVKKMQEPCEDAISRKAVLKQLKGCLLGGETEYKYVKLHIDSIPPAIPQPKTGRWIYGIDEDTGKKDLYAWTCSECEGKYPWQPKYCPNCGAKMESEDKE